MTRATFLAPARVISRIAIDWPATPYEAAERLALAAKRGETWLCLALALGCCAEIWIGIARTAALYPVGP